LREPGFRIDNVLEQLDVEGDLSVPNLMKIAEPPIVKALSPLERDESVEVIDSPGHDVDYEGLKLTSKWLPLQELLPNSSFLSSAPRKELANPALLPLLGNTIQWKCVQGPITKCQAAAQTSLLRHHKHWLRACYCFSQ
jgi:hypothetical protein